VVVGVWLVGSFAVVPCPDALPYPYLLPSHSGILVLIALLYPAEALDSVCRPGTPRILGSAAVWPGMEEESAVVRLEAARIAVARTAVRTVVLELQRIGVLGHRRLVEEGSVVAGVQGVREEVVGRIGRSMGERSIAVDYVVALYEC
jgi:hypothetical protein